jgi:PD-(D/E)XK nuclease superfamily
MAKSKTVSYSQYSIYKQCPYRWYLDYVKKLQPFKPSIHLIFGTAFHETLQNYLKVMYEESATAADKIHLPTYFKTRLMELYKENSTQGHFSTPEELTEFYEDAVAILDFIKRKRGLFFKKKNSELVGIEIPINGQIVEGIEFVKMKGFIDLVIHDKTLDKYIIYDIKTSTRGWSDYEKKDQTKINQILLYKRFFSVLKEVPEDKIDVQFFIVRRKINENLEFVPKRVQEFIPANGTKKVKAAFEDLQDFVKNVFTVDGEYQEKAYIKNIDKCKFCPYLDRPDLCDRKNS